MAAIIYVSVQLVDVHELSLMREIGTFRVVHRAAEEPQLSPESQLGECRSKSKGHLFSVISPCACHADKPFLAMCRLKVSGDDAGHEGEKASE